MAKLCADHPAVRQYYNACCNSYGTLLSFSSQLQASVREYYNELDHDAEQVRRQQDRAAAIVETASKRAEKFENAYNDAQRDYDAAVERMKNIASSTSESYDGRVTYTYSEDRSYEMDAASKEADEAAARAGEWARAYQHAAELLGIAKQHAATLDNLHQGIVLAKNNVDQLYYRMDTDNARLEEEMRYNMSCLEQVLDLMHHYVHAKTIVAPVFAPIGNGNN